MNFNLKKEISNSSLILLKTLNQSRNILKTGLPIGRLYQAFQIDLPEAVSPTVINATLDFKISKDWLIENNISFHHKENRSWVIESDIVGNVKLYRNPNETSTWTVLNTNFVNEDNNSYSFSATSPGFSTFAIFLNKYDCLPNSVKCENNNIQLCLGNSTWLVTETCPDTCESGKCTKGFIRSDQFYTLLIVMVGGFIAIVTILLVKQLKKKRYKPYSRF